MTKEYIDYKETVELFVSGVVSQLNSNDETPKVNVVFPESAFSLFYYVKEHPFVKEGYWTPDITEEDIERLREQGKKDASCMTIYVQEPVRFFELVSELINSYIDYRAKYYESSNGRALLLHCFKPILIRMGVIDFMKPEEFLEKQIDFLQSDVWDDYIVRDSFFKSAHCVGDFLGNSILAAKREASQWYETSEKMTFTLVDDESGDVLSLPSVYYGIREENGENVCYIYAVQNERERVENKKLSRKLYKLNKGVESSNVHPSQVLALKTFLDMVKDLKISKVKVPARQVLNYAYHELLADEARKEMERWTPAYLEQVNSFPFYRRKRLLREYEWNREWASHVIDKEDFIESAKTGGLYNIFYRVAEQFGEIEILNDPFIEDEYLHVRIKREKVLKK